MTMNTHDKSNLQSTPSQVSVKLDGINSQVVSLHILENNMSPQILIPHMYIAEGSVPFIIGSKNEVLSVENQVIPVLNKTTRKPYSKFSNICTEADTSFTSPKSLLSTPFETAQTLQNTTFFKEVIPTSKSGAINKQIELIHPSNYTSESTQKCDSFQSFQNNLRVGAAKNTDTINDFQYSIGFKSCQSKEIGTYLTQDAPTQNSLQINTQPLNYDYKFSVKKKNNPEHSGKSNSEQPSKTSVKKKVQNYVHISDVRVPQRAIAVLPTALQIRGKDNIFPRRTLPARIRFGPLEGIHKVVTPSQADCLSKAETPVFLLKKDDEIIHIDVSDKDKCNWMGLLPAGGDANVWLYQENNELYAITTEPINARKSLRLGYSLKYAEEHKLPPGVPTLDLETVLSSNPKRWWCNECNRALPSASLLQRHSDVYHKDDIISTRRGYRCLQCRRAFSRLFTLRRHISKHCTKKKEKPTEPTVTNSSLELNTTLKIEENKMPSDESFQNFPSGLDFSANFFDTDRISNLDISGNSRTDDFNPYDITFRDDTCTGNDLSFSKLTNGPLNTSEIKGKKESALDSCINCGQVVKKGNKRKHISECPSNKKLDCACGKTFRNREKLAQHFLKDHPADDATKSNIKSSENNKYTCEQCNSKRFKRRGMLVNHLWRAHNIVSTLKVECPVRHYPCVACPKIYRSAAKRDRHVTIHHPGSEKLATQSIAGGVRSCEPAVCAHCPRQYATRAKLLQHVRAQHGLTANNMQTPGAIKRNTALNH